MRGLAAVAGVAVVMGAPAVAQAASCPTASESHTFLPWVDPALYTPAPDGGLEQGTTGWTLSGGAAAVEGNEPYHVGTSADERSLALPPGSIAVSPPTCVDVEHPDIRFFARNTGSPLSLLSVSVVFKGLDGRAWSLPIGTVAGGSAWAPTAVMPVGVNLLSLVADQEVSFALAPLDASGSWQVDDIYVDPYGKR
jgi:hypothetical protein